MIQRNWASSLLGGSAALVFAVTMTSPALAEDMVLKKGTQIKLVFDSYLNSKTAKPGDRVAFKVEEPVQVDGKTVIPVGTKEMGTVEKVNKRARYGINA